MSVRSLEVRPKPCLRSGQLCGDGAKRLTRIESIRPAAPYSHPTRVVL